MMRRDHALLALREHVRDGDIVVAVYQACFDWLALSDHDLTYVATGAMGQAVSHGLGLALACPDRRVLVFDGDGSLLMNLGALVTVAGARVSNLHHFVFANGTYEVNGAHPLPGDGPVDFAAMALAAGYASAETFSDLDALRSDLPAWIERPGPTMATLRVVPGEAYPRRYDFIHSAEARTRFRNALASSRP
ncbi:MAG: thiamine pyrophosphate-binding protein [Rhodobacteraceae bacterium]|nr:thiamine pyrophosphate-binding protein [Paracoccaceae bacterium]